MTNTAMPQTADDWTSLLVSKTLPTPFKVGKAVLRNIQRKSLPYAKIAELINRDPILSFRILSQANKNREAGHESSKTLSHALSMVGIEELTSMLENQPFKALSLTDIKSFYYLRIMSTSLYAGHLGRIISLKKKKGNSEDVYWSSLFLGTPTWYLWRFATPEMRLIRYAIRSNFKLPTTAESEVLGDTLENITAKMANELALPEMARQCYNPENQLSKRQWVSIAKTVHNTGKPFRIDDRDISMKMQSPHFIVMLANLIAHYSSYCWYSKATLRAQKILASYLQCTLDEAIQITHEAAAQMSRAHPMPGMMLPAAKIILPPRLRTKATNETDAKDVVSAKTATQNKPQDKIQDKVQGKATLEANLKKASTAVSEDTLEDTRNKTEAKDKHNPIFTELISIMQNRPEDFIDLHELMNAATQGIAYGVELKRTCVGLISKDKTRFKNYYSVGCQDNEELANFESPIAKDTIFAKLSARPASIWVKANSDKKILDLTPQNFKDAINAKEYFLMSVFVGRKPVAIFYADNNDEEHLTNWHYQQFKEMCSSVSSALQYQANNKK